MYVETNFDEDNIKLMNSLVRNTCIGFAVYTSNSN